MDADGPTSAAPNAGGWMVSNLLGPYQGPRTGPEVRHVLLVEVPTARAQSLARALEESGHRVFVGQDMREALELIATVTPDLVLLGGSLSAAAPLLEALEGTSARGVRPQLVTDTDERDDFFCERLRALLAEL